MSMGAFVVVSLLRAAFDLTDRRTSTGDPEQLTVPLNVVLSALKSGVVLLRGLEPRAPNAEGHIWSYQFLQVLE